MHTHKYTYHLRVFIAVKRHCDHGKSVVVVIFWFPETRYGNSYKESMDSEVQSIIIMTGAWQCADRRKLKVLYLAGSRKVD